MAKHIKVIGESMDKRNSGKGGSSPIRKLSGSEDSRGGGVVENCGNSGMTTSNSKAMRGYGMI